MSKTSFYSDVEVEGSASVKGTLTIGKAQVSPNGYLTGTWLQTTGSTDLGHCPSAFPVLENGWLYKRTLDEIKEDLGIPKFEVEVIDDWVPEGTPSGGTVVGTIEVVDRWE